MRKIIFNTVLIYTTLFCVIIVADATQFVTEMIRPEDQGEDFSLLSSDENFTRLTSSADKFARWKAAKVLGSRFIDGKFKPTQDEQKKINEYVEFLLTQFKTNNPGDAGDASAQLWRLWGLAIPALFEALKSKDRKNRSVATEHLVILRNENIVKKLIDEYDKTKDVEYKRVLLDTIGKMRTMYDNRFSYRKMMSSKKSRELSDKLIVPFLDRISVTEKDSPVELQNVLKEAKKFIEDPPDSRAYLINPKTGEKILMTPEPPDDEPSTIPTTKDQPINDQPTQQPPSNLNESKNGSKLFYYCIALIIIFVTIILVAVIIFRKRKSSPTIPASKS